MAATAQRKKRNMACTGARAAKASYPKEARDKIARGGNTAPATAVRAPRRPPSLCPTKKAAFTVSGPGALWAMAVRSHSSAAVNAPSFSTNSRRIMDKIT